MKRLVSMVLVLCLALGCAATAFAGRAIDDLYVTVSTDRTAINAGETVTVYYQVTGGSAPYKLYANYTMYYEITKDGDERSKELVRDNNVRMEDSQSASGSFQVYLDAGTRAFIYVEVQDQNEEWDVGYAEVTVNGSKPAPDVSMSIKPRQTSAKAGDTVSADYSISSEKDPDYLDTYVYQFDGKGHTSNADKKQMTGVIQDQIRPGTREYYFSAELHIPSGWSLYESTDVYPADPTGSLGRAGWVRVDDDWYYCDETGTPQTGWKLINGFWYFFNNAGIMKADTTTYDYVDDEYNADAYYLNADGQMVAGRWFEQADKWWHEYIDGEWVEKSSNAWYYADESGRLAEGWNQINGVWYYFNSNKKMLTGWRKLAGTWYYLDENGAMQTGWQQIGGVWYYLGADGAMRMGWQQIGGVWYYFNATGAMVTGWQQIGGVWYYFHSSGAMATGTVTIGGTAYSFDANGAWVK